jgi:hypothetical protein
MLLLAAPIVGIVLGLLMGGSLTSWERVRFRWPWVILVALLAKAAATYTPLSTIDAVRYVYVLFLLVLIGWTLLHVRWLPGVWLVTAGAACNLVVILANGARMPVSASSGYVPRHSGLGVYVIADTTTRLNWLGDWIGLPAWLGGATSPGDFLIALGVGAVAFSATRRATPRSKLDEPKNNRIGSYPP